jgi:TolB-like protein/Flp pilus assembly protein TadD
LAVTEPSRAVFLSYASQDTPAAQRICEALRSGGIEVWFDKNELRGGDAWDRSIRQQIHDCALFMPIISGRSDARHEGYFRREWRLAVERAGDMSDRVAFLVPIVIDDTSESSADVPDRFRALQWTRLPGGETPPTFVERVQHLLSGDASKTIRAGPSVRGRLPASPRSKLSVAAVAMIAVALLLVLGYLGLDRLRESRPGIQSESIAVLPLTNESGDAAEQYFSDGISEDLITALSQFPGLKVIGRASSFLLRDSKEDSRSIGAKLGVAHLLEGSVRRSGDVVRISAELINTEDGSTQWSERYDRPYKDLFSLQDEITRAVAGALKAKLLPAEHEAVQSDRPPSGSLEAYNAYLQGKFYNARDTEVDYRKAIEFFTRATQLDPRYTRAWCGLSTTWTSVGAEFLDGAPAQEAYAKAREAASRALGLSPGFSDAHLAQGYLFLRADFNWRGAEAEYRRAAELAPNDANAKFAFGNQLTTFGEMEQAVELTREALATEPLRADWYNWLAVYLSALNRLDEAEQAIRRAIELQPGAASYYEELTVIEVQRGNARAALAAAQLEHPGIWQNIALALARSIGGDPRAADAALKTLIDKDAGDAPFQIAEVYALRDEADETFAWLDRAWRNRDPGVQSLLYDPFILRFKHDPRFAAFSRKVGLPVPGEAPASKST